MAAKHVWDREGLVVEQLQHWAQIRPEELRQGRPHALGPEARSNGAPTLTPARHLRCGAGAQGSHRLGHRRAECGQPLLTDRFGRQQRQHRDSVGRSAHGSDLSDFSRSPPAQEVP